VTGKWIPPSLDIPLFVQVAVPDVVEASSDSDIIIFVLPHQFIKNTCSPLIGKMKPGAIGLSLIKVRLGILERVQGESRAFTLGTYYI
jgi:glycerol-3-phosphate dehydrogenase